MASEEDLKARDTVQQYADYVYTNGGTFNHSFAASLIRFVATAITAARAETWKEAIMFVNIADIGDAKGADATYKIGKMLEAAAGSQK